MNLKALIAGTLRYQQALAVHQLTVTKVIPKRKLDQTVTYTLEVTNAHGVTKTVTAVATRNPKDKFNKAIGHQVAYGRALKKALLAWGVAEPNEPVAPQGPEVSLA